MTATTATFYRCQHPEARNSNTTLLTRSGRQAAILIDGAGNARQYRDHEDGYQVATRRIEQEVADILLDAGWTVAAWPVDEGGDDDIAMLGDGAGGSLGLMFNARHALDPHARQEMLMSRVDALALQVNELQQRVQGQQAIIEALVDRVAGQATLIPTTPTRDGEEHAELLAEAGIPQYEAPTGRQPAPLAPTRRGRGGSRAVTDGFDDDETVAGAAPKSDALAGLGQ